MKDHVMSLQLVLCCCMLAWRVQQEVRYNGNHMLSSSQGYCMCSETAGICVWDYSWDEAHIVYTCAYFAPAKSSIPQMSPGI